MLKRFIFFFLIVLLFQGNINAHNLNTHKKQDEPKPIFALVTIPKCGTHFAMHLLELISKRNNRFKQALFTSAKHLMQFAKRNWKEGYYCMSHHPVRFNDYKILKDNNIKIFFLVRDFRDSLVSMSYVWFSKYDSYAFRKYCSKLEYLKMLPRNERIIEILTNRLGCFSTSINQISPVYIRSQMSFFSRLDFAFKDPSTFYIIKFENIIGPKGGGNYEIQLREIQKIAEHIGYNYTLKDAKKIADELNETIYGNKQKSNTFRKGLIGEWKNHFDEELKNIFKKIAGDRLIQLGYEKDYDW